MSLLIFILIVLVVLALAIWLVNSAPMFDGNVKWAIQAILVIIGIVAIIQRAGWMG